MRPSSDGGEMIDLGLSKKTFSSHAIHAPVSKFPTPNAAQAYFQKELTIGLNGAENQQSSF
jgi:hypothetical protein